MNMHRFLFMTIKVCCPIVLLLPFVIGSATSAQEKRVPIFADETSEPKVSLQLLGTAKGDAQLAGLIPPEEIVKVQKVVAYTFVKASPGGDNKITYAKSGYFKVLKAYLPEFDYLKSDVAPVIATLVDKDGKERWKGQMYSDIYVSSNGRNLVSVGWGTLDFFDITSRRPIKTYSLNVDGGAFSDDGRFFIAWGKNLYLFTADGEIRWEKSLSMHGGKNAVISSEGSYILINDALSKPNVKREQPERSDQRDKNPPGKVSQKIRAILGGQRQSKKEEKEKQAQGIIPHVIGARPIKMPSSTGSHFTLLRNDGSVIKEFYTDLPFVHVIAFSPDDGKYGAVASNNRVLFFESETGNILWEYEVGKIGHWIEPIGVSENGEYTIIGVSYSVINEPTFPDRYELINVQGKKVAQIEVDHLGHQITFSEGGKYIVARNGSLGKIQIFEVKTDH